MSIKTILAVGVVALVAIGGFFVLMDHGDSGTSVDTEGAFVRGMVPHHESAIEMARIAEKKAEHPEIRTLAGNIVAAQTEEIMMLNSIHQRLYGEPVGSMDHGSMGLNDEMMGMSMDPMTLKDAKPFDREFIDMMVAHHQGAIRMAQIQVADGEDGQTTSLAERIIVDQTSEINQMNEWRTKWYGSPSPAGGIPDADETMGQIDHGSDSGDMHGMEH